MIKTTHIDGDVSVGRDLALGGGATIQGNMHIKSELRVDGVLYADHVNSADKGIFPDLNTLKKAYPSPKHGWWAIIGDSPSGIVYTVNEYGLWSSTRKHAIGKSVIARTFINANVLFNTERGMTLQSVADKFKQLSYDTSDWLGYGTVITFFSEDGWRYYRYNSTDPALCTDKGLWVDFIHERELLSLMRSKPSVKRLKSEAWGHDLLRISHPVTNAVAGAFERDELDIFPLKNVRVCLMVYQKKVRKKERMPGDGQVYKKSYKKGWCESCLKVAGPRNDYHTFQADSGSRFVDFQSGEKAEIAMTDVVDWIFKNYMCTESGNPYKRDDFLEMTYEQFYAMEIITQGCSVKFGSKFSNESYVRQNAYSKLFGIAIRCDNPEWQWNEFSLSCTQKDGIARYIYSDVFPLVCHIDEGGRIGFSLVG